MHSLSAQRTHFTEYISSHKERELVKVYYKTSAKGAWKLLKTTKTNSLTKTGLTSGKTYYFAVKAYKTVGKITKYSDISAVKTLKVK